ncbi:carbon-nitrogen hydrolase family protein [Phytohabitans sp. ZYX-F-186]|uniref:Carbon-nitrogen hydrolase family protein n=1 Tax=Phytohabitans maris TaxID=3071409 RepID=A0ABU0ZTB2_9ACTN|nr:carbon-nitrogen hydrolase family protein [Phytohabitans sp. ZYX-F-186]MDQ7910227.1 carbon-nitrogen hydrolase family protein [Phytohabitans sp. ZYX-F-186]
MTLTIAVAQPPVVSHDLATNVATHAAVVRAAGTRVVVFPEMSLTGYELEASTVDIGDPRLAPLVEACAASGALALVGAPVEGPHIATLAVDGGGVAVAYRKLNLGGGESTRFVPGTEPAAIDVDGWRLGLAICKDTGVPRHAAQTAALGIDAYVAGVAEDRPDVLAERAHRTAATHGVWVAVASFAGPTGGGYDTTAGRSTVVAPTGEVVALAGPEPGEVVRATLTLLS